MKIAIDVDDVITEAPAFFAAMTQAMKAAGHEIHIVTDFDEHFRQQREKELAGYGIEYDALVFTGDKAGYCADNDIDLAIDDDPSYFSGTCTSIPVNLLRMKD